MRFLEAIITALGGLCLLGASLFLIQMSDDSLALRVALEESRDTAKVQRTTITNQDTELNKLRRNIRATKKELTEAVEREHLLERQLRDLRQRAVAATPEKRSAVPNFDDRSAPRSEVIIATEKQIDELARIIRQQVTVSEDVAELRKRLKRKEQLVIEHGATIANLKEKQDIAEQVSSEQQRTIDAQATNISEMRHAMSDYERQARIEREKALARQRKQLDSVISRLRRRAIEATPSKRSVIWRFDDTTASSEELYSATQKQIDELGRLIREKPTPDQTSELEFGKILKLRDRLAYGVETSSYDVQVYPDNQLVTGRTGKYYVVDLKNAASGIKFRFDAGRYSLARSSRSFRESLGTFMREVVTKLEGNVTYNLYVRGSADAAAYRGIPEDGYAYSSVSYLKAVDQGRYSTETVVRNIGQTIRNADLPFLRAEFLRSIVSDVYPVKPPKVLEGMVTRGVDAADRNAELIMFVEW